MAEALNVDYDGLIPNNVGLSADPRLRRALESWYPGCLNWWRARGPEGFQDKLVYLRTAISVEPEGWAKFGYVKMPDYRWGILLAPAVEGRTIPFGAHQGEPAWQEVPGEYRAMLRRLIVVQGDTEPASVEQQRQLGRIIEWTVNAMRAHGIDDPTDIERVRALGVIDLPTLQKRANLHFSLTLDLFGSEISTNAANVYNAGLKGRFNEDQIEDDHRLLGSTYPVLRLKDGRIVGDEVPALSALNMRLRDDYVGDAQSGVERWWNRIIERAGFDYRLKLPHVAFHRHIGEFAAIHADPDGNLLSAAEWERRRDEFLPSDDDNRYIQSLMRPVTEPGIYASWIAQPKAGIDGQPGDFEYVQLCL